MEMPAYMLVRYKIRDFFSWKRVYDAQLMKRIEAGLIEKYLFRGIDDPNEVMILYEARDLGRAKALSESSGFHEMMEKGGMVEKPIVNFLSGYSEAVAKASGF
jgi:hypothetical protein